MCISPVQVLPYNFESRDRGTKLRVTVSTVLVCFFQIEPPHRFHLLFLQDECFDIDRLLIDIDKGNFVVPEDFSRGILLQNFRGCIRQIPDPPVWRGCPALPQAPAGRMQVVHRLPEYDRRKTYRIFREKNLCSLRVFASEPENVRFPCERSRYELFDGGFLSCVQGCGKRFPRSVVPVHLRYPGYSMCVLLCESLSSVFKDCGNCVAMKQSDHIVL